MDWLETVIGTIISGGLGVTIGTIYTARKNAQVGMNGNEVEAAKAVTADWTAYGANIQILIEEFQKQIAKLESRVNSLESDRDLDKKWISLLQDHIQQGLGPPAPSRPSK